MRTVRYSAGLSAEWDAFVDRSKNGTFLFKRAYMEYHAHRFQDVSLLVYDDDRLLALVPASVGSAGAVVSHGGLTYGGVVSDDRMTATRMLAAVGAVAEHYLASGFASLVYKTVPHIYHRLPAEEDRYALFRADAVLRRRDVLTVVVPGATLAYHEQRRRGLKRAKARGIAVAETRDFAAYWAVLEETLAGRHGVRPVHSVDEMTLLAGRFPQIRLFAASAGAQVLAGVVVYETERVAHAQYIAANEEGRASGALDATFDFLISHVYRDKAFLDFGSSNEQDGRVLNAGLVSQKEGFGGRAIVHDFYELDLERARAEATGGS